MIIFTNSTNAPEESKRKPRLVALYTRINGKTIIQKFNEKD